MKLILIILICVIISPQTISGELDIGAVSLLKGTLERNSKGETNWNIITEETTLKNGDRFRTNSDAYAIINLVGNCKVFLNAETKIIIESNINSSNKISLNNITLLNGSVIVVSEKAENSRFQHNITTSVSSLQIQNSSCVYLKIENRGETLLTIVINGIIPVRNVLYNESIPLSSGNKLYIDKGNHLERPEPVENLDLNDLQWINRLDSGVIEKERGKDIMRKQRVKDLLSGGTDRVITVCKFQSQHTYNGSWDIENRLSVILAKKLKKSTGEIIKPSKKTGALDELDSMKEESQLIIKGNIENFSFTKTFGKKGKNNAGFLTCKLTISLELINTDKMETIAKLSSSEIFVEQEEKGLFKKDIDTRPFSLNDEIFHDSIVGRTVSVVIEELETKIKEYLQ